MSCFALSQRSRTHGLIDIRTLRISITFLSESNATVRETLERCSRSLSLSLSLLVARKLFSEYHYVAMWTIASLGDIFVSRTDRPPRKSEVTVIKIPDRPISDSHESSIISHSVQSPVWEMRADDARRIASARSLRYLNDRAKADESEAAAAAAVVTVVAFDCACSSVRLVPRSRPVSLSLPTL